MRIRLHRSRQRGHSLVELLVVIGIMAIVMGMILAVFISAYRTVKSFK